MARILVVDDDPDILETIEISLAHQHEVHTARDGRDALDRILADASSFDILVLDLMMPRMTGAELVWALRARGIHIPIILTSAVHDLRERAAQLAAADYVSKPFSLRVLRSKIASLVARSSGGSPPPGSPALTSGSSGGSDGPEGSTATARAPIRSFRVIGRRVQRCSSAAPRATRAPWRTKNEHSPVRRNNNRS